MEEILSIVEKWGPTMESRFGTIDEKKKELMCKYAESHVFYENHESHEMSCLPMSLSVLHRVLDDIDLDEVHLEDDDVAAPPPPTCRRP